MLRLTMLALGASLVIGATAADEAVAQSGRDRTEAAKRGTVYNPDRSRVEDRDRDWERDRDWDDDNRRGKNGKYKSKSKSKGNGPAFCRSGEGHPVHGREWCRQKGWGLGNRGGYDRVDWGDVVLRRGRIDTRRDMNRSVLEQILGRTVYGRFDRQRSRLGYSQPLYGRWAESNDGSVLRLMSGSQPIAQIIDRNRDGRADYVLLYNGR